MDVVSVAGERVKVVPALPLACAHCPWRISNQGKQHPHNFYAKSNLRRLWNGLRTGEAPGMSCHPTDPHMAEYEGYEATADREETHECAGSVILLAREFMRFQAITLDVEDETAAGATLRPQEALKRYRAEAGAKGALTRDAIAGLLWRLAVRTPLNLPFNLTKRGLNDPDVGCPFLPEWDTEIEARSQRRR